MTKKEVEEKKEHARLLFMQGETQKNIAKKLGISEQTLSKWVRDGGWSEKRAAENITRPQLVNKLLKSVDTLIEKMNESEDPQIIAGAGDTLSKFAASIKNLDKKSSIVDVIEVFMAFGKWLQYRASFDDELTPELLKAINRYQDLYITELLGGMLN